MLHVVAPVRYAKSFWTCRASGVRRRIPREVVRTTSRLCGNTRTAKTTSRSRGFVHHLIAPRNHARCWEGQTTTMVLYSSHPSFLLHFVRALEQFNQNATNRGESPIELYYFAMFLGLSHATRAPPSLLFRVEEEYLTTPQSKNRISPSLSL